MDGDVDLDAREVDAAPRPPRPAAWGRTRRQRTAVLVVVLLAAVAGAVLGAWVADRRSDAVARDELAVLAVQAGLPSLVRGSEAGSADSRGLSPVRLAVPLSNRGPAAVTVTMLGLDAPHQRLAEPATPVVLDPGATVPALIVVDVDCARQLSTSPRRAPSPGEVAARLDLPTGPREVALPIVEILRWGVAGLLTDACAPPEERSPAQSARWSPRSGGRLVVTVSNALRTTSVDVDLRQTPGLGSVSDPPLPLTVPALGVREVTLTLEPDCAAVGPDANGTSSATLDLVAVAVADGIVQTYLPDDDASGRRGVRCGWRASSRCGAGDRAASDAAGRCT